MSAKGKPKNQELDLQLKGEPSNAELKRLLNMAMTRLENWRVELEANPNPRMVHVLKNILAHIETLTALTESRISYSYKTLSRQMSVMVDEVAKLNLAITDALLEDDMVDEREEEKINEALRKMFQAALNLMRLVQQAFMERRQDRRRSEPEAADAAK